MAHEAGKGSTPRPFSVSQEEYNSRWDTIFSKDKVSKEIESDKNEEQHKQDTKQVSN